MSQKYSAARSPRKALPQRRTETSNPERLLVQAAALPVPAAALPVPAAALPTLSIYAQLDTQLTTLDKACFPGIYHESTRDVDVAAIRAALPHLAVWRREWRAVDRPATSVEIAAKALWLTTKLPLAGNIDPDGFADELAETIAEMQPTLFVLERAARALFRQGVFLPSPAMEKEFRRAAHRAKTYNDLLECDLPKYLEETEEEQDRLLAQDEEYRRQRAKEDRERIAVLREECGGILPEGWQRFVFLSADYPDEYDERADND